MARPFLSIIIPAYNEAERLPLTLIYLDKHLREQDYSYEVLIVDDGSDDATPKIAERFAPIAGNLKLIKNTGNRGKGSAVKIGMLSAKGNWCLAFDADNSIPITEFNKMVPHLAPAQFHDIVIASRGAGGTVISPQLPLYRRMSEWGLNRLIRAIFKSNIKDFQLGFHCFSKEAADKIFSLIKMDGWSYSPEALLLGERLNFKIKEVAVRGSHPGEHSFRFYDYLKIIWDVFKIRWWIKRDKYNIV